MRLGLFPRTIRFPRRPARSYAYRDLGTLGVQAPQRDEGVRGGTLHARGNDLPESLPASLRVIDGPAGSGRRQWYTDNVRELNSGTAPVYIRRLTRALNGGAIRFGTGPGPTGASAMDVPNAPGALYIPHQAIPRRPMTVTAFRRTVDTSSTIPARGIGAPVR